MVMGCMCRPHASRLPDPARSLCFASITLHASVVAAQHDWFRQRPSPLPPRPADYRVAVLSIRAAGTGLTLTAASTVGGAAAGGRGASCAAQQQKRSKPACSVARHVAICPLILLPPPIARRGWCGACAQPPSSQSPFCLVFHYLFKHEVVARPAHLSATSGRVCTASPCPQVVFAEMTWVPGETIQAEGAHLLARLAPHQHVWKRRRDLAWQETVLLGGTRFPCPLTGVALLLPRAAPNGRSLPDRCAHHVKQPGFTKERWAAPTHKHWPLHGCCRPCAPHWPGQLGQCLLPACPRLHRRPHLAVHPGERGQGACVLEKTKTETMSHLQVGLRVVTCA